MTIQYEWIPGPWITTLHLDLCSALYSNHYGTWSEHAPYSAGKRVRLSPGMLQKWIASPDTNLVIAKNGDQLVGYAIAVTTKVPRYGVVSWVTQLVVHEDFRREGVAKTLLFSCWTFSSHSCWGLVTANPYAVRALEKATRRRCAPSRIKRDAQKLLTIGRSHVSYVKESTEIEIGDSVACINTEFYLDHASVEAMVASASGPDKAWVLGELKEGWEWMAFTFHDQEQLQLTPTEVDAMLRSTDDVTRQAYSRMSLGEGHSWARHSEAEADVIFSACNLKHGSTLLDLGCGVGRHINQLSRRGVKSVGVDYTESLLARARRDAKNANENLIEFIEEDCRTLRMDRQFDAVICLYDVIGSFVDNESNAQIVRTIAKHLKAGGYALLSVMNLTYTAAVAKHTFTLAASPDRLLDLDASNTMEATGDVFDPEHILLDTDSGVVYRKEQFSLGRALPTELIVRDRRWTAEGIRALCEAAGLEVIWHRYVRSGSWLTPREGTDGKEILILCRQNG